MERTRARPGAVLASPRVAGWVLASALAVVALRPALDPLWDADFWWILRAGTTTLAEGRVPVVNRYSFTAPDHPWVMHEWGFGALFALLHGALGLPGVALARVAFYLLTAGALLVRALRDVRRPVLAALLVALALAVYGGRFGSPRPVGLAYAFAALSAAWAFEPGFSRRHALAQGALMLVWVNCHGSFPLGLLFAALGCALPGALWRPRALGLALSLLATGLNPYGLSLHRLVAGYSLGGDPTLALVHERILEWWPLTRDPWRVADLDALAVGAVLVVLWLLALRHPRWRPRAAAGLALAAMALAHNRHLQLFGLLSLPLAAGWVDELLPGRPDAPSPSPGWSRVAGWCVPALVVGLGAWGVAVSTRAEGDWVDAGSHDEDYAALVGRLPEGARLYTSLAYTGYALWRGRETLTVLYDTRNDCYPYEVLRAGFDLSDALLSPPRAREALDRWGTTHAIVRRDRRDGGLFARLGPEWREREARGALVLYERAGARPGARVEGVSSLALP